MQRIISQIHQGLARIFLAGLLLQFYLAGAALFGVGSFAPHRMLGDALTILVILFPVLAVVGRLGWQLIGLSMLLVFLTIVQIMLPSLRVNASWIAALHPVNALALMGVSATIRRYRRAEALQVN
jgi:Family of unknown function (DUF6220)